MRVLSLGIPLLLIASSTFCPPAFAATTTWLSNHLVLVQLPASVSGWQDTGIDICPGATWFLRADGLANHASSNPIDALGWLGPGGVIKAMPLTGASMFVDGAPEFSLVGMVGSTVIYVGEGFGLSSSWTGRLYLAYNDDPSQYGDNAGAFIITLNCLSGDCVACSVIGVAAGDETSTSALGASIPNPMTSQTRFAFETVRAGTYEVDIVDVQGRRVREIYSGSFEPGRHWISWDGTDAGGRKVAAGTYHYRATGEGVELARKVVVIR